MMNSNTEEIMVLVADNTAMRGPETLLVRRISLDSKVLEKNVSLFLLNMENVLEETPEDVGGFQLAEISVKAEITADGKVVLCGVGGEVGISGGIEFTFKRK